MRMGPPFVPLWSRDEAMQFARPPLDDFLFIGNRKASARWCVPSVLGERCVASLCLPSILSRAIQSNKTYTRTLRQLARFTEHGSQNMLVSAFHAPREGLGCRSHRHRQQICILDVPARQHRDSLSPVQRQLGQRRSAVSARDTSPPPDSRTQPDCVSTV